ncbi:MAG: hypothetical protein L6R41_008370 [Letrouitia leprolyta]|nr:MAG: hypothetical protein L6R41_008370 [Letrouitia leprolyta]
MPRYRDFRDTSHEWARNVPYSREPSVFSRDGFEILLRKPWTIGILSIFVVALASSLALSPTRPISSETHTYDPGCCQMFESLTGLKYFPLLHPVNVQAHKVILQRIGKPDITGRLFASGSDVNSQLAFTAQSVINLVLNLTEICYVPAHIRAYTFRKHIVILHEHFFNATLLLNNSIRLYEELEEPYAIHFEESAEAFEKGKPNNVDEAILSFSTPYQRAIFAILRSNMYTKYLMRNKYTKHILTNKFTNSYESIQVPHEERRKAKQEADLAVRARDREFHSRERAARFIQRANETLHHLDRFLSQKNTNGTDLHIRFGSWVGENMGPGSPLVQAWTEHIMPTEGGEERLPIKFDYIWSERPGESTRQWKAAIIGHLPSAIVHILGDWASDIFGYCYERLVQ